jgi:hypothetical protein
MSDTIVVIQENPPQVIVTAEQGPQGPPGPQGQQGNPGTSEVTKADVFIAAIIFG